MATKVAIAFWSAAVLSRFGCSYCASEGAKAAGDCRTPRRWRAQVCRSIFFMLLLFVAPTTNGAEPGEFAIGVAKVDVTPSDPIRLTGYAVRKTNSVGVEQKLWAKALAIGNDDEGPAILVTLDNCGIAESSYRELVRRLAKLGVKQSGVAICMSHTHAGPCTTDWAPNIFAQDIPGPQQRLIDSYTRELLDKMERVVVEALENRKPGLLSWARGKVEFARNRRTQGGPVDHDLPVLRVTEPDGKIRALVANYACHCTTLGGEFNKVHGDWAGFAQQALERDYPGATALITIGCGADSNPHPRGGPDAGLALAEKHGQTLAAEVKRLVELTFQPITGPLAARLVETQLDFAPHFTREQWEARAKEQGIVGYHARKYLARLDEGEKLPAKLYYPIVTWAFGDDLAMVFLPGEVVVDYALRLKDELDPRRLWVTAYANYVPCYIPSRRILKEGGYEAESSLWYYDRPAKLAPENEDLIINNVIEGLPKAFKTGRPR